MIPEELKELILKYCQGQDPTQQQEDEITDKVFSLGADPVEVNAFIESAKKMKSQSLIEKEVNDFIDLLEQSLTTIKYERNPLMCSSYLPGIENLLQKANKLYADNQKVQTVVKELEAEKRRIENGIQQNDQKESFTSTAKTALDIISVVRKIFGF